MAHCKAKWQAFVEKNNWTGAMDTDF